MISFKREGDALEFEGSTADLEQLRETLERALHPDQKRHVTLRVVERGTGRLMNIILRRGQTTDAL